MNGELQNEYSELAQKITEFTLKCRAANLTPSRTMAMIIAPFFTLFDEIGESEWRRDVMVHATNLALKLFDEYGKGNL